MDGASGKDELPLFYVLVLLVVIITGTVAQSITAPGDNIVEGRSFTLQCRINRGGNADVSVLWARIYGANVVTIYQSYTCDPNISLRNGTPAGLSGSCNTSGNGEEVYSLIIENITVNMENFIWRCTRASDISESKTVTLSVKVSVTSVGLVGPSTSVVAETPATFTCTTSRSKPKACAKWFIRHETDEREMTTAMGHRVCNQNLTTLQTTTTLTFNAAAEDDGANLYCTASNSVTDTPVISLNYPLDVLLMVNSVSLVGPSTSVVAGTPTTFTCTTSRSRPNACATWFIRGKVITTGQRACNQDVDTLETTSTLEFNASARDNGAKLYCTAINNVTDTPVQSQDYPLNVQFGPGSVILSANTTTNANKVDVTENNTVTFTCTSAESNPAAKIYMYIQQVLVSEMISVSQIEGPNKGYIVSGRYSTRPTRDKDGGDISCQSQRTEQEPRVTSNKLFLDVQYGPLLSSCKNSYTVVENQSLNLTCTAWAKPDATFTWDRGEYSTVVKSPFNSTSKINFPRINRSDTGNYFLSVFNTFGRVTKNISVTVNYPPTVAVVVRDGTEVEGSKLVLECQADGVPPIDTFSPWIHYVGDIQIPLNDSPSGSPLQINDVNFEDQGFYECSARNSIGKHVNRTEVKISASPKFPKQITKAYSPVDKNVKISVGFVSYPSATKVSWYAENAALPLIGADSNSGSRYAMNLTSNHKHNFTFYQTTVQVSGQVVELEISNLTRLDFQKYVVVVENNIGASNHTITLDISDRPCPPILNAPDCGISKADISWISCFNGGYEQTFSIEVKKGDKNWTSHPGMFSDSRENSTTSSEILELEASQKYSFRVYAKNKLGQSYSAEKSCIVKEKTTPPGALTGPIAGGATGGVLLVVIVVGVILFRRRIPFLAGKGSAEKDKPLTPLEGNPPRQGRALGDYEDVDGFESPPDLVASGVPAGLYAAVDKRKKGDYSTDVPAGLYADVKKPKKETPGSNGGPIYAQANKPAKKPNQKTTKQNKEKAGPIYAQAIKPTKNEKKGLLGNNKKASKKQENLETYANAAFDAKEVIYSNADTTTESPQEKKEKVEGELLYADMDFAREAAGIDPIIHPSENNTTYASIQLGVVGPPVPEDDDEEEGDLQNQ